METIGFVDYGSINSIFADFAVSRHIEQLQEPSFVIGRCSEAANAASVEDAIQRSNLVFVSIPLKSPHQLPSEPFVNKVVDDTMNYYLERDGAINQLDKRLYTANEVDQRPLGQGKASNLRSGPRGRP